MKRCHLPHLPFLGRSPFITSCSSVDNTIYNTINHWPILQYLPILTSDSEHTTSLSPFRPRLPPLLLSRLTVLIDCHLTHHPKSHQYHGPV